MGGFMLEKPTLTVRARAIYANTEGALVRATSNHLGQLTLLGLMAGAVYGLILFRTMMTEWYSAVANRLLQKTKSKDQELLNQESQANSQANAILSEVDELKDIDDDWYKRTLH
jgi:uncharacterized membrane protein